MSSFTKKVFGLAGAATVFAGMAFGQATCTQASTTNIIRAEGTTEQVAPITITCSTGAATTAAAGTGSLQVFLSPALPVTSKVLSTTTGNTEAVAVVSGSATQYNATVSGSTVNIAGIVLPVLGNSANFTVTISNIRVNATSLSVGSGVPPSISATTFISGSAGSVVPAALGAVQVSFAQNGLAAAKIFNSFTTGAVFPGGAVGTTQGSNNFVICNAYKPGNNTIATPVATTGTVNGRSAGLAFVVQANENFASSFKTAAGEASILTTTLATNAVANGTRLSLNLSNVPNGVTLYVPNAPIPSVLGGASIIYTNVAAGTALPIPAVPVAGSTAASIATGSGLTATNGLIAVPLTSGAGTAVFEVVAADANALDSFNIPVFVVTTSNGSSASATGISASVSFSPTGSTLIPNFTTASSTNTLTGSVFNTCSTSLLFPFVTNQLGFDTGIAIANTSTDPFGTQGATAQAGTCTLNMYGSGAPSPANVTTANIPSGTVQPLVLSSVAAGFQGYIIAQCNFQYAHGFAFITNGVGVNGGLSQGYLAGVIPDVNQVTRATGTGETLGN